LVKGSSVLAGAPPNCKRLLRFRKPLLRPVLSLPQLNKQLLHRNLTNIQPPIQFSKPQTTN
jgi:hypothetical protein